MAELKVIRIHIASDDSEDCDDEIAKMYLRQLKGKNIEFTYIFTGAQNLTAEQSRDHWLKTFEPYVQGLQDSATEVKFYTLDEYTLLPHVECDYFLQIAPVRSYDGANLTVTEKYVLAGDRIAPEGQVASFNMKDSDVITKKFFDEGKLIDISSLHMATMRMDGSLLLGIPDHDLAVPESGYDVARAGNRGQGHHLDIAHLVDLFDTRCQADGQKFAVVGANEQSVIVQAQGHPRDRLDGLFRLPLVRDTDRVAVGRDRPGLDRGILGTAEELFSARLQCQADHGPLVTKVGRCLAW